MGHQRCQCPIAAAVTATHQRLAMTRTPLVRLLRFWSNARTIIGDKIKLILDLHTFFSNVSSLELVEHGFLRVTCKSECSYLYNL